MAYITADELNTWFGIDRNLDAGIVDTLCDAATAAVDAYCGRVFTADSVASARVFTTLSTWDVNIDDAWAITSVKTDESGFGTYSTTWATSDYFTTPFNGVGQNGHTGWPTTRLCGRQTRWFTPALWPSVQVTAKWGWAAVPDEVKQATLMLAAELLASKDAPLGITAVDVGGIQVRGNLRVQSLLNPFTTATAGGGKFLVA